MRLGRPNLGARIWTKIHRSNYSSWGRSHSGVDVEVEDKVHARDTCSTTFSLTM